MVSSQPTRLIFPLCWVWFRNSFLGKSSAVIFLLPAKWITSLHPLSTSPSLLHFQKKNTQCLVFGILNTSDRHFTRLEGLPMLCRRAQACELPAASEVYWDAGQQPSLFLNIIRIQLQVVHPSTSTQDELDTRSCDFYIKDSGRL